MISETRKDIEINMEILKGRDHSKKTKCIYQIETSLNV